MSGDRMQAGEPASRCDPPPCSTFGLWKVGGSAQRGSAGAIAGENKKLQLQRCRSQRSASPQLGEGREGKVMFLCHLLLPITAPRGPSSSRNITPALPDEPVLKGGLGCIENKGRLLPHVCKQWSLKWGSNN